MNFKMMNMATTDENCKIPKWETKWLKFKLFFTLNIFLMKCSPLYVTTYNDELKTKPNIFSDAFKNGSKIK